MLHEFEKRWRNHFCLGRAIIFTYPEWVFVVALFIQHGERMCGIILSYAVFPTLPDFTARYHIIL